MCVCVRVCLSRLYPDPEKLQYKSDHPEATT